MVAAAVWPWNAAAAWICTVPLLSGFTAAATARPAALVVTVSVCDPPANDRGLAALDRERDGGAADRQVVLIAHLDDRRDGGLLLDDVDRAFALDHDDAKRAGGRLGLADRQRTT